MKKKILYISARNPYSSIYSGDRDRAKNTIEYLIKFYKVDLVCLEKIRNFVNKNKNLNIRVFKISLLNRFYNLIKSLLLNVPIHSGFYFSQNLLDFTHKNFSNYDYIFCNSIKTAQYLPSKFKGKKILDMIDLDSYRYKQIYKSLSIFNPLFYVYLIEYYKLSKYEKIVHYNFNKIFFVSIRDLKLASNFINKKKLFFFPMGISNSRLQYKFNLLNDKIIFIGNMKYFPNKHACYNFIKNIFPKILKIKKNIKFYIIGDINLLHKIIMSLNKNVIVVGKKVNLSEYLKNTICAICNTEIASGIQTKILTYMSFGIPTIVSKNTLVNKNFKNNSNIVAYSNSKNFIKNIIKLSKEKRFANKISKNSLKTIKNYFDWNKICNIYLKNQLN